MILNGHEAYFIAHAQLHDYSSGEFVDFLEVISSPCCNFTEKVFL